MMDFRPPVTLEGRYIRLVPLTRPHVEPLAQIGKDPEIWQWLPYGYCGTDEAMGRLVDLLLRRQSEGDDLAFTVVLRPDDQPVGMTRYLGIDRLNRNVEVGGTWFAPSLWRTPVNSESKLLMLGHAFGAEGCVRVQLKTDRRNLRSQQAIERLGSHREGVWRQHMLRSDGTFRDSVVYSILDTEWPTVRLRLERTLQRPWERPARTGPAGSDGAARI
ncbi:MAG TPA: GNAT family protein [Thermoplasmata archaeon]|nr:GNAT family protein [Thermoplasmata archaeon]